MSNKSYQKMVAKRGKNPALEQADSPSRDSDSICDSDAGSPVPFLCTQDGAEGETDVVWNFYTPKSGQAKSRLRNSTPLSSKAKKASKPKVTEKPLPKRRALRSTQKQTELFQELLELNQNLPELLKKKSQNNLLEKPKSESEDDIFSDTTDCSPKSIPRLNSHCLRKNVLSSKFNKIDNDTAIESDDSMNECLIKASQVVEENILKNGTPPAKRGWREFNLIKEIKPCIYPIDHDSIDAILNSIKFDSPTVNKVRKCESPNLNNDSFENLVGNLNDSALERLTQVTNKNYTPNRKTNTDWKVRELVVHEGSPSTKSLLSRHNSMPESPTVTNTNKPSTSGMVFGRYNSMPYPQSTDTGDSPIRCTPDEIKRKHQQAREKLLAKRLLPFTSTQPTNNPPLPALIQTNKKTQFQPKVPSSMRKIIEVPETKPSKDIQLKSNGVDVKLLIEKKRQEALMKLRRRQPQNKML